MNGGGPYSGSTLDEALSGACSDLKARIGELHYEVVDDARPDEVVTAAHITQQLASLYRPQVGAD